MRKEEKLRRFYDVIDNIELYSPKINVFRYRINELIQILHRHRNYFGKYALDVGCGGGISSFALEIIGLNVFGIDIQRDMIEIARNAAKKFGFSARFFVGDASNISFQDVTFDSIFFLGNVLVHISREELARTIDNLTNYLNRNGVFVFHYCDTINEILTGDFFIRSPQMKAAETSFSYNPEEGHFSIIIIQRKLRDDLFEAEKYELYIWAPWILKREMVTKGFKLVLREKLPRNFYLDIYQIKEN